MNVPTDYSEWFALSPLIKHCKEVGETKVKGVQGSAIISPCEEYRYALRRQWLRNDSNIVEPLGWLMLNPSVGDAELPDHTITKTMGFAHRLRFNHERLENLFAFRSKDRNKLLETDNPIGEDNDAMILDMFRESSMVVCAWGSYQGRLGRLVESRVSVVAQTLLKAGVLASTEVVCFGRAKTDIHAIH